MISLPLQYLPRLIVNPDHFSSNTKLQPEGSCKASCIGKHDSMMLHICPTSSDTSRRYGTREECHGCYEHLASLFYLPIQPMYMYMYHILHVLTDTPKYFIFVPTIISLIPRLLCPSGEDSLVFKVRILQLFLAFLLT